MSEDLMTFESPAETLAPAETTNISDSDTGAETESPETGEQETPEGEQLAVDDHAPPVVNGKLSPAMKATLDQIKATNPAGAKAITRSLFAEARLLSQFPSASNVGEAIKQTLNMKYLNRV